MVSGRVGDPAIRSEKRHPDHLGQGHIRGVIGSQIVPQLPDPRQEWFMAESPDLEESKLSECTRRIETALPIMTMETLRHLEVNKMRGDEIGGCESHSYCF